MTSPDPDLKSLFCEALERPGGPERDAYLEDACRGNPASKRESRGYWRPTTRQAASSHNPGAPGR